MTRAFTQGQSLLAHVADAYRQNPNFWAQDNWGYFRDGSVLNNRYPSLAQLQAVTSCCLDAAIMRFGPQFGGEKAVREARGLLYQYIPEIKKRKDIWAYNDDLGRTVEDIIEALDMAAHMDLVPAAKLERLLLAVTAAQVAEEIAA
jgi:hypothetical protein